MSTIGDDLLRPASRRTSARRSGVVVYNSNPVAVAPDSARVAAGFAREDLFTVVLEHFLTDTADHADVCCRPPRSWSTGTRTPATATPGRC
jgi:anaerobic selenocysteine-containing dehydrogenase